MHSAWGVCAWNITWEAMWHNVVFAFLVLACVRVRARNNRAKKTAVLLAAFCFRQKIPQNNKKSGLGWYSICIEGTISKNLTLEHSHSRLTGSSASLSSSVKKNTQRKNVKRATELMVCRNGFFLSDLARVRPLVLCVFWVSVTVRAATNNYFHCRPFTINRLVYKLSKHAFPEPKMTSESKWLFLV